MKNMRFKLFITLILTALGFGSLHAEASVVISGEYALDGNDITSYYDRPFPVKGDPRYQLQFKEKNWLFADKKSMEAFQNAPDAYMPQYNGWCGWALAQGRLSPSYPEHYVIYEGKLFLMCSRSAKKKWMRDQPRALIQSQKNWEKLNPES